MSDDNWREKLNGGGLYACTDEDFVREQLACLDLLYDYNHTRPSDTERRQEILKRFFGTVGEDVYVEQPLHANWGRNTHWGSHCYSNFNLTLVDDTEIYIGSHCMFGPNVVLATAGHPALPELRWLQYSIPIKIGDRVWIGANAVILPGVQIGDNSVIGAGSVVTKDVPPNVIAVGNPCKLLREIGDKDREYYYKNYKIN